jgi:hypothetical protein
MAAAAAIIPPQLWKNIWTNYVCFKSMRESPHRFDLSLILIGKN